MMGAFQFVRAANKAGIKAIVGAELNVCRDHTDRSSKTTATRPFFSPKTRTATTN